MTGNPDLVVSDHAREKGVLRGIPAHLLDDVIAAMIELHDESWRQEDGRRVYQGRALGKLWRVVRDTDLVATVVTIYPGGRTPPKP